jgi:SAM-dependent methyltransferase
MAEKADRYELYERAVHDAGAEVDFLRETYARLRRRQPQSFREDFSGQASAACEWVRRGPRCRAMGVDIEPEVLEWGRAHRLSRLPAAAQKRVSLVNADVLTVRTEPVDVIAALNFSYWVFRTRRDLLAYFRNARRGLKVDGLLVLDAFGGYEAFREMEEHTRYRGFTYVWDQAMYRPVTGEYRCHIHFRFPDGSKMEQAFTYDWRLWTLPELRDLLLDAGFRRVTVYWEGDDGKGGGNGEFTPHPHGDADATWIAYLVAER